MGQDSKIEWTHHTFNPWWGCVRVSPGCEHCYAETFAKRVGQKVWGVDAGRRFFGEKHWAEPLKWDAAAEKAFERRRVFCASMADVFEDRRDLDDERHRLFRLIEVTPHLDWLLLTKRPQNFDKLAPGPWVMRGCPPNVWMGTTVEDQKRADERVPVLLRISAHVHFLSCEPLLGQVNLRDWLKLFRNDHLVDPSGLAYQRVTWVIVGGESGHGARPFSLEWARSVIEQCRINGVTCFVKQLGADPYEPYSDGERLSDVRLKDRKGGDWDEWPDYGLRVREFPA